MPNFYRNRYVDVQLMDLYALCLYNSYIVVYYWAPQIDSLIYRNILY